MVQGTRLRKKKRTPITPFRGKVEEFGVKEGKPTEEVIRTRHVNITAASVEAERKGAIAQGISLEEFRKRNEEAERSRQNYLALLEKSGRLAAEAKKGATFKRTSEEEAAETFEEATGAGALAEELESKILEKPSLKPEPILAEEGVLGDIGRAGMRIEDQTLIGKVALGMGVGLDPGVAPLKGAVSALAAVGAGAFAAAPYVVGAAATGAVKSVMATKLLSLKGALASIVIVAAGGGLLDWRGLEMNTQRKIIGGFVEDGEKIVAIDRATGDHETMLNLLTQAAAEIDEAERILKEAGNNNFQNKIAKEYLDDMNNIRTARLAVFRRVNEIILLAETGQAALKPEELIFQMGQLERGK